MALVDGAARSAKKFTDIGAAVADGFKTLEPEPTAANLGNTYPGVPDGNDPLGKVETEEEKKAKEKLEKEKKTKTNTDE